MKPINPHFLVTTHIADLPDPSIQIVMVDGTVPNWQPRQGIDLHFDHHNPDGAMCQLEELPLYELSGCDQEITLNNYCFVTTQVDADACVAAAAIIIASEYGGFINRNYGALQKQDWYRNLQSIALDCDHLGIPANYPHLQSFDKFAANVVAGLKEQGFALSREMRLPQNRQQWTESERLEYHSACFKQGTLSLVKAVLGESPYPMAVNYWNEQNKLKSSLEPRLSLVKGSLFIDLTGWDLGYIDPRIPLWVAAGIYAKTPYTLTKRDRVNPAGTSYTLGCDPAHPLYSQVDYTDIWAVLTALEQAKNPDYTIPGWGGRKTVGGSSWNQTSNLSPDEILEVLDSL